jgi:hypothetical protein
MKKTSQNELLKDSIKWENFPLASAFKIIFAFRKFDEGIFRAVQKFLLPKRPRN